PFGEAQGEPFGEAQGGPLGQAQGKPETSGDSQAGGTPASSIVERVGDIGFIQLQANSFRNLDARHQALAYWLTQASIAIDPIVYDQLSPYGLREKRLLEEIVARPAGLTPATFRKIREYALLFWANRGNHNATTGQKFLPPFTADELLQAALTVQKNGGFTAASGDLGTLSSAADVQREIRALT